ncbi:MAG: sigma-70 family RNA polymerase sigma factor [Rubripirellula sp.]
MISPETRASLILRLSDPADDLAWAEFLQVYEPMLFRLSSRWGLQEADAREVVQETLLAVAKSISNFSDDRQGSSFRRWLSTITRNKLADHLASRSRQESGSGDTDVHRWLDQQADDTPSASLWDWNEKRQVFAWAAENVRCQVSDPTWQAFYRTHVQGDSVKQVAADLGMHEGMIYVARSRVMSRLRKAVTAWTDTADRDTADREFADQDSSGEVSS